MIHIARIPVAVFGHALRTPMRPDAELGIAIPLGRVIGQQGIPIRLKRAFAIESLNGRLHGYTVPGSARQFMRLAPGGWRPVRVVQLLLHDLAVNQRVENPFTLGSCTELLIGLMDMVKAGGGASSRLPVCRNGRGCGCGGDQLAKLSSLHRPSILSCIPVLWPRPIGQRSIVRGVWFAWASLRRFSASWLQ